MSLKDRLEQSIGEERLRDALRRSLRDLERARASKEELVDAVYRAARDACAAQSLPRPRDVDRRRKWP
jgi:hypothetical protein